MEKQETSSSETEENRLIAERRAKLGELRQAGQAYPNDFRKDTTSGELIARFGDRDAEALAKKCFSAKTSWRMSKKNFAWPAG